MGKLSFLLTAGLGAAGGFVAAKRMAGGANGTSAAADSTERLVHIARIRSGSEGDLRRLLEERFPVAALAAPGLTELNMFIGNGYLLTEYGYRGEFEPVFQSFRAQPGVADYLQQLGELLDDEPAPQPDMTAAQMLTSQALHWDRENGLSFTPRVRPAEASTLHV
jgi:hypothetical protein